MEDGEEIIFKEFQINKIEVVKKRILFQFSLYNNNYKATYLAIDDTMTAINLLRLA